MYTHLKIKKTMSYDSGLRRTRTHNLWIETLPVFHHSSSSTTARSPLLTRVVLTNHNNYATYLLITSLALENYNYRNTFDCPYNVLSKCSFQKTPNNKQHGSPKYGNTMKNQPDLKKYSNDYI